jgi:hypothetical protein
VRWAETLFSPSAVKELVPAELIGISHPAVASRANPAWFERKERTERERERKERTERERERERKKSQFSRSLWHSVYSESAVIGQQNTRGCWFTIAEDGFCWQRQTPDRQHWRHRIVIDAVLQPRAVFGSLIGQLFGVGSCWRSPPPQQPGALGHRGSLSHQHSSEILS